MTIEEIRDRLISTVLLHYDIYGHAFVESATREIDRIVSPTIMPVYIELVNGLIYISDISLIEHENDENMSIHNRSTPKEFEEVFACIQSVINAHYL